MFETDDQWRSFGRCDPYYGVISDEKFRLESITPAAIDDFFRSGAAHVDETLRIVRERVDADFKIGCALDFGCGVGRVTIALAQHSVGVVGVDVSESMISEARAQCAARGVGNVDFAVNLPDGVLFNFVHSFIVFQHIPPSKGFPILSHMLQLLAPGGVGVLHFTYGSRMPLLRRVLEGLKRWVPPVRMAVNILKGRHWRYPYMLMANYDLCELLEFFSACGITQYYTVRTDHGGYFGVILYFQKPSV